MSRIKTLKKPSEALFTDRSSKFYAYAFPLENKEKVKERIAQLQQTHLKANHFCSAFSIGQGDEEYHLVNDDGEPNNSAGSPILGQIKSFGLSNVLIVVVRYFGGTKLGVGGLINAYKTAARAALENGALIEVEQKKSFSFQTDYQTLGSLLSVIDKNSLNANIKHHEKTAHIVITVNEDQLTAALELFKPFELEIQLS